MPRVGPFDPSFLCRERAHAHTDHPVAHTHIYGHPHRTHTLRYESRSNGGTTNEAGTMLLVRARDACADDDDDDDAFTPGSSTSIMRGG